MNRSLVFAFLLSLAVAPPARAALIISTGNNPQPNEENVLFNAPGLIGLGNPVTGLTNQSGIVVTFTGIETLVTPSAGQSRVEALDGSLTEFVVALPGATFEDYIFNLNAPVGVTGTASIEVVALGGWTLTGTFGIGNGENFFTVLATGGDRITSVDISSDVPLTDVRQNRISGASPLTAPEPATVVLVGVGLLALVAGRRR